MAPATARERREADLAQRGPAGLAADRRRQQDVVTSAFSRASGHPAAGPQADGSGDGGDDADESGRQAAHIVDAGRREGIIADGAGEEQDGDDPDAAGQVGAVQGLEPLDSGHPAPRRSRRRSRRTAGDTSMVSAWEQGVGSDTGRRRYCSDQGEPPQVAAGRDGSTDQPDHDGT